MFYVTSYPLAIGLCVVTMLGWGSWANTLKLAPKGWEFPLYYWDYAVGLVLTALLFGFTFGSIGEQGRGFAADLAQAGPAALGGAFVGGVVFNLSNLLIVAATAIAGMSVAFPIAVGLALVIGVVVNYLGDPVGDPYVLFGGTALVVVALLLNARAYAKLQASGGEADASGTAAPKSRGIALALASGILMGFFYRFVADAMVSDFAAPEPGLLTPYSAMFVFTVGILASSLLFNVYFMRRPVTGEAVTFADYRERGSTRTHLIGLAGGLIWCTAMEFNLVAAGAAGPAISYGLGQGATLVAALWGVFVWREFDGARDATRPLLAGMFACFVAGLALIVAAKS